ncbi:GAF domain-containing protein [Streptomyces sp. NPDC002888]|uniref:GAF domain-containing protein n=1 Tax=Streptomyces sp. NPDC002888 TaxID=3364668 RepID=UPI00368E8F70
MTQTEEFGEELADFVRRVAELKASRSVSVGDLPNVLDAAIFELDHVAGQLWPWYERLSTEGTHRTAPPDRQEQQLLRAVFQSVPVPVALIDRETVVRRLNLAATALTGARAGYATGRPLTGLLAHADRAAFRSQAAAVARGEGDRSLTVHLQQRPSVPVHATLAGVHPPGEPRTAVLVVLRPAGAQSPTAPDRPSAQAPDLTEATRHATLMDLLDAMTTSLLTAPPGDHEAVLEGAARVLHARFADWVIADAGRLRLSRAATFAPSEQEAAALSGQDPIDNPLVVETARSGITSLQIRPEDPKSFGQDATGTPFLVTANVTSLVCVPLKAEETVLGVLTLFRCGSRPPFSLAEAQTLDTIARHIALTLGRSA